MLYVSEYLPDPVATSRRDELEGSQASYFLPVGNDS